MSWRLRVLVAIERRRLALAEWVYRWRHWADANWYLTDDDHLTRTPLEGRDVADSPPADAVAPSSRYGCGATACVACYGNEAWAPLERRAPGVLLDLRRGLRRPRPRP